MKNKIKHLTKTTDLTKCGIKINENNFVIDINLCTCKKCKNKKTYYQKKEEEQL